ncbi:glycoside hydrolase family 9 protein [Pelagicoccus mobilis]|uniref:Glycoside hydrolase family 9 protein n=1 Tax=Pelagicoccus mobilis TaxID=415221 RepID=A0A934S485_9BACT|nr:glycoside hydrolase family 9 protein [Pelagicoccus mobilis]MBK1878733.1 glycoside hydrolase family 9 protein [Pelagicoccus mobilis]
MKFPSLKSSRFLCSALFPILLASTVLGATPPPSKPKLVSINPVSKHTLSLTIQQGELEPHRLVPYLAEESDEIVAYDSHYQIEAKHGITFRREVIRNGEFLGFLSGDSQETILLPDAYSGAPLDIEKSDTVKSYTLFSDQDSSYAQASHPIRVSRKTKPKGFSRRQGTTPSEHRIFLSFAKPLQTGASYKLDLSELNLDQDTAYYRYQPRFQRSEAIHVNQAGFAPEDPLKRAYVSLWTGQAGNYKYDEELSYHIVDKVRGVRAYSGKAKLHWAADRPELMNRTANLVGADVYRLDFSELKQPGLYHVYVDGVGCSYPFEIRVDAWKRVAQTSFRGIFHQRSGFEFEPPYTDFWRPRAHHPDDGVKIYQSKATLLDTSMGPELSLAPNSFIALIEGATDEIVPNAWGGLMDGGDWDRRAQHLVIPRLFLELYQLSPDYFDSFTYNIPESENDLPDIVDEALWVIDFHLRYQWENGAISGGVESAEHPAPGDLSWNEIIPTYAYWPDYWSTHQFVAAASLASRVLGPQYPELGDKYKKAAVKGMKWAEQEYAKEVASGRAAKRVQEIRDIRNLAAIELYHITGDKRWHSVFEEDSILTNGNDPFQEVAQRDALFSYLALPKGLGKDDWKELSRKVILSDGDNAVEYSQNNAFSLVAPSRESPIFIGFYSGHIHGQFLARAHALSGDEKYLRALHAGAQFGLGANPDNVVFMSGIGANGLDWILYEDALKTGRKAPEGIVPYGPLDTGAPEVTPGSFWVNGQDGFGVTGDRTKIEPEFFDWPVAESHLDMWNHFMQTEPTPWQSMAPSTYSWAYMASQSGF